MKLFSKTILFISFNIINFNINGTIDDIKKIANKIKNKKDLSPLEKFIAEIMNGGPIIYSDRVTRWEKATIASQKKFILDDGYIYCTKNNYPEKFPSMIHRFPKEIDEAICLCAYFRVMKKDKNLDNSAYAVIPATISFTVGENKFSENGMLEYGFNINTRELYHRCFKGIGWTNSEESYIPISHLFDNLNSCWQKNLQQKTYNSTIDENCSVTIYKNNN
jgi:hypothetical protein